MCDVSYAIMTISGRLRQQRLLTDRENRYCMSIAAVLLLRYAGDDADDDDH
jgi:hypothetical protein